jgi:hypothetical protein
MDKFEWDSRRAGANRRRHGVELADAVAVLEDERALTVPGRIAAVDEPHHLSLGRDALARVIVVAYSRRADRVRILSARRATGAERTQYRGRDR